MRASLTGAKTRSPTRIPIDRDVRALLIFLVPWTVAAVLVFLGASGLFETWEGQAVSIRRATASPSDEAPAVWRVLVVGDRVTEVTWPAEVVTGKGLPVDARAVPPLSIPEDRPITRKAMFQLHFLVQDGDGWQVVPTTSPRALGVSVLLFLVGLGVRNMMWAGSPVSIRRREVLLPQALPVQGAPAQPSSQGRGSPRKQPPPGRPRRGPRR